MNKYINFEEIWNRLKIELIVKRKKAAANHKIEVANTINEILIIMESMEENV